jgi:hypothetical protein
LLMALRRPYQKSFWSSLETISISQEVEIDRGC